MIFLLKLSRNYKHLEVVCNKSLVSTVPLLCYWVCLSGKNVYICSCMLVQLTNDFKLSIIGTLNANVLFSEVKSNINFPFNVVVSWQTELVALPSSENNYKL